MSERPCNARSREWHRCELTEHDGDHWSLEGGTWPETLTVSGDSRFRYLTDERGHIVATLPAASSPVEGDRQP